MSLRTTQASTNLVPLPWQPPLHRAISGSARHIWHSTGGNDRFATSGSTVVQSQTIAVTVNATDDVAVAAVNLLVNGQPVLTDSVAPYVFYYTVPATATTLTLSATAVDYGGNVGNRARRGVERNSRPRNNRDRPRDRWKPEPAARLYCAGDRALLDHGS